MTNFTRFALYFAPEPGPLADFGAAWLGWDLAAGQTVPRCPVSGLPLPIEQITETPSKYGLHGTIKPPFHLAVGSSLLELEDTARALCARQAPVTLNGLELTRLGGFLALTVPGETSALQRLAATMVEGLDACRAAPAGGGPITCPKARLSDRQEALLTRWGYPYVMEEFRFHITLSGKMPKAQAEQVKAALVPHLEPLLPSPFVVRSLCLAGEDAAGMFHLVHRYTLSG